MKLLQKKCLQNHAADIGRFVDISILAIHTKRKSSWDIPCC